MGKNKVSALREGTRFRIVDGVQSPASLRILLFSEVVILYQRRAEYMATLHWPRLVGWRSHREVAKGPFFSPSVPTVRRRVPPNTVARLKPRIRVNWWPM